MCYGRHMPRSDIRELAQRLLHDPRRDSLGLGSDVEAQLDMVDAVAARFFRDPSEEGLRDWRSLVEGFADPQPDGESRARVAAHRALVEAVSSHALGDPAARTSWASSLGQNATSVSHVQDLIHGLGVMLLSAFTSSGPKIPQDRASS